MVKAPVLSLTPSASPASVKVAELENEEFIKETTKINSYQEQNNLNGKKFQNDNYNTIKNIPNETGMANNETEIVECEPNVIDDIDELDNTCVIDESNFVKNNNNNECYSNNKFNDCQLQNSLLSTTIIPQILSPVEAINVNQLTSSNNINPNQGNVIPIQQTTTGQNTLNCQQHPHQHHHHHHHVFPVQVISLPQPQHPSGSGSIVTGAWPLIEPPVYVDANGEPRHYCPAHSQQCNVQREHRVLLHLDAGVSLPLQIGGKRKVFRGPTTVQMVSQNRPPPIPVPVQVPQGQVMQQYVNESGTLTHVVLSPTQYQQLHTGQGGVPHIHAPFITANGTTSHFYSPLTTGFPGQGGAPHFHPMSGQHLQPQQMSHSPHSPSPPNNYHKDDRTQRQHSKLLRKLDQKREINSALSTPAHSPSPRKSDINGMRRSSRNGASSVGTSEDGEESSSVPDEEDDYQMIMEQLSTVQKPEVTDITSRSAMLRWEAPPVSENLVSIRDLRYDILLSDRGKEGKYKIIFKGESYVCMIQDLRPGQEYFVCLQVHFDKIQGCASEPTVFTTPPCEPDQPAPPKLIGRTKNSLQLRWNQPIDNGSHIINYIIEYDEGKSSKFIEMIKTKGKQYTVTKLQPSTQYSFRLIAINECGKSPYSDIVTFRTSGNPPQTPKPPTLKSTTSTSLRLAWERCTQDEEFVLQMSDKESGIGYLNMYSGIETTYECKGLRRATTYHFRLRAENEAGTSSWSNDVTYKTQPERPGRPGKPQIKGKIYGTYFKIKWDPPNDKGGSDIKKYFVEISSGAKFEKIYTGNDNETICDHLNPGTTYQIRVSCENLAGISNYSDICTVTTEAIIPGIPEPPFVNNPPGPYAVSLRWDKPDYNGGAPILEYEIQLNGINYNNSIVYKGKATYCNLKDLIPGEEYLVNLRAINRIGPSLWSENLKFRSGAAPPYAPNSPKIHIRSATQLTITWNEPYTNGAAIIDYRLEYSLTNETNDCFNICYQGIQKTADIKNLIPFTIYYFRICATNSAGTGPYSTIFKTKTPAAVPNIPQILYWEITANDVTLHWSEPENNGSDIINYNIDYGDKLITTDNRINKYTIKNLNSETNYKFKIQAVNNIGPSPYSNSIKLTTLPPPPKPPKLECTGIGHNFLKLKWGDGRNINFINYYIEMYNQRSKEFQIVYHGTNLMCKINKLQEQTSYIFRIYAETDQAGVGEYSNEYVFKTSATLPSNIKTPRIIDNCNLNTIANCNNNNNNNLSGNNGLNQQTNNIITIEWQHSKNTFNDPIEYILQFKTSKDLQYKEIYRGIETKYSINNLESGQTYLFRVCPIRITSNNEILGNFSNILRYQVPHKMFDTNDITQQLLLTSSLSSSSSSTNILNHNKNGNSPSNELLTLNNDDLIIKGINSGFIKRFTHKITSVYSNRKRFSDQQKAIFWMFFFLIVTICFAALIRMLMR